MKTIEGKKKLQKEKGITLIALVVTIVVLLILAGISVSMLTGNSSIIEQTKQGKEQTEIGEEREKVELSAAFAIDRDAFGVLTEENFAKELDKQIGPRNEKYKLEYLEEENQFKVTYIEKDEAGNVTERKKLLYRRLILKYKKNQSLSQKREK